MKIANVPKKMSVVFGVNGQRQDLLADTVAGEPNASYNAGFPPITMIAKSAGGQAPLGKDFNQIFNELAADAQWNQASGIYPYDSEFSAAIGGYPKGSVVLGSDGITIYQSTIDDNESDPSDGSWNVIPGNLKEALSEIPYSSNSSAKDFLDGILDRVGLSQISTSTWVSGATSTWENIWRYEDGSLWWQINGTLPDSPDQTNATKFNVFSNDNVLDSILYGIIKDDDPTDNSARLTILKNIIMGKTGPLLNGDYLKYTQNTSTMSLSLDSRPMANITGMMCYPDYATYPSYAPATMTASEIASNPSTYTNRFMISTYKALGINTTDTTNVMVLNMVTTAGRGFRIAFTPGGSFYFQVMASAWGTWGTWYKLYGTSNTTVASDGSIHAASPIARVVDSVSNSKRSDLLQDDFAEAGDCSAANNEARGISVTKTSTGTYSLVGSKGLAKSGWQVKDPYPLQGSSSLGIAEATETTNSDGSVTVTICLYAKKMTLNSSTYEVTLSKGDLIDVPSESWIDLRLDMGNESEEDI